MPGLILVELTTMFSPLGKRYADRTRPYQKWTTEWRFQKGNMVAIAHMKNCNSKTIFYYNLGFSLSLRRRLFKTEQKRCMRAIVCLLQTNHIKNRATNYAMILWSEYKKISVTRLYWEWIVKTWEISIMSYAKT